MILWLSHLLVRKKEQEWQLQQQQEQERITAFDVPSRPYVLIMFKSHVGLIRANLERGGLETRPAHTNAEALAVMKIAKPAVLICYTSICASDGAELIKAVHNDSDLANISIVVVAQDEKQNSLLPEMQRLGATECFAIPFVPIQFAAAVIKLMPCIKTI